MTHPLWDTEDWSLASDEAVIAALLDAPRPVDPFRMAWVRRHRPHCIRQMQIIFYGGEIPRWAAKP